VEDIRLVADEAGLPMTQMAIAWVLANPAITAPIIGASRPEQLRDSINASIEPLSSDVKERLDDITEEYRMGDAVR
ncbi:MAG: aldo/keto reductase, partial [Dehalococcoidia bacterium]|nr:aldo/keto reductase [Dehalococcoidia bacterium]